MSSQVLFNLFGKSMWTHSLDNTLSSKSSTLKLILMVISILITIHLNGKDGDLLIWVMELITFTVNSETHFYLLPLLH